MTLAPVMAFAATSKFAPQATAAPLSETAPTGARSDSAHLSILAAFLAREILSA